MNCLLCGCRDRIDGLPGDEHRHDGGLARAGGELQREAHQFRVGVVVGIGEMFEKPFASLPDLRSDLGQPDGRFDRLDLAEERADAAEFVVPPVLEEPRRLGSHVPVTRVRQPPPLVHLMANCVDDRGGVVLLLLR